MDMIQKFFENIFIEDKSNKIIYQTWCLLILSSRKEEDNFWSAKRSESANIPLGIKE